MTKLLTLFDIFLVCISLAQALDEQNNENLRGLGAKQNPPKKSGFVPCSNTTLDPLLGGYDNPCAASGLFDLEQDCTYFPNDGAAGSYTCECDGEKCEDLLGPSASLCRWGFTPTKVLPFRFECECDPLSQPNANCGVVVNPEPTYCFWEDGLECWDSDSYSGFYFYELPDELGEDWEDYLDNWSLTMSNGPDDEMTMFNEFDVDGNAVIFACRDGLCEATEASSSYPFLFEFPSGIPFDIGDDTIVSAVMKNEDETVYQTWGPRDFDATYFSGGCAF